ncbi:Type-2 restriction enzyme BsuMI component YdjA [Altererythrobacter insulae]|nr:Type-2 restriction enzyme BsuMI component YdjA [Altererythrobacter insulae]
MATDEKIEWVREGDWWPEDEDSELRARLAETGALSAQGFERFHLRFVGVIAFRNRTLVSLPKIKTDLPADQAHRHVMRAMRHYEKWQPTHHTSSPYLNEDPTRGSVSGLAATDWLIKDFAEHGLFRRSEASYELNGSGHTNWRRTIEQVSPVFSQSRPIYLNTVTRRSERDNQNFATRLHLLLLEKLSNRFAAVLDLEPIKLDHEPIERLAALPSAEECETRLMSEQRQTYSQRGIELLSMMRAVVAALEIENATGLSLYGTSYFHHVWEAACATAFGNEVAHWLPHLPSPLWTSTDGVATIAPTFIPDLVAPLTSHELLIGDAKYYRASLSPKLIGVPGVNDVAKQIWYKQGLLEEARKRGYHQVQNAFLFPTSGHKLKLLGRVELPAGGEKVDAVAVPFLQTLAAYSGDAPRNPEVRREEIKTAIG